MSCRPVWERTRWRWCSARGGPRRPTASGRSSRRCRATSCSESPRRPCEGHHGTLRSVRIDAPAGPIRVLLAAGRSHLYEGHDADAVVALVRAVVLSGCSRIILTNAAGSLRPAVGVGEVVVISDHLNLTGVNPMAGAAPPGDLPSRFVDLTNLYDATWRAALDRTPAGVHRGRLRKPPRRELRDACRDPDAGGLWVPTWWACRPLLRRSRRTTSGPPCWGSHW